jgi:hypothetical protein
LDDPEIHKTIREKKIKGCSEEGAQLGERYKQLHPRYKAKIGQQYLPQSNPHNVWMLELARDLPQLVSTPYLQECSSLGLHSVEGDDLTPSLQQALEAKRNARTDDLSHYHLYVKGCYDPQPKKWPHLPDVLPLFLLSTFFFPCFLLQGSNGTNIKRLRKNRGRIEKIIINNLLSNILKVKIHFF